MIWPVVIFSLLAGAAIRLSAKFKLDRMVATAVTIVMVGLPTVSFAKHVERIATTNAIRPFLIPKGDWDSYVYLEEHSRSDGEIVASNWNDIELLPMLHPVNLFFANNALQQRKMSDLFSRYVAVQKLLGMDRARFERMIDNTFRLWLDTADKINRRSWDIQYPIQPDLDYVDSHFAFTILYWPYVRQLEGVKFSTDDLKSPTPEFKKLALDLFDRTDAVTTLCASKPSSFLVSADDRQARMALEEHGLKVRFQTSTRVVYGFDRGATCRQDG